MFSLYLFALVVGGGMLLISLFGHHDGHGDLGHHGVDHHGDHESPAKWLSLRTLIYFLFVFGGVGAVLTKTWHAATMPIILLLAVVAGLGVGATASALFAYLRKTDSGDRAGDDTFVGTTGRVTLPMTVGGAGKVLITRGNRTFELTARPFAGASGSPRDWKSIIVVEMANGIAVVAPLDDPAVAELASLNPS